MKTYVAEIKNNIEIRVDAESLEDAEMKLMEKPDIWSEKFVDSAKIKVRSNHFHDIQFKKKDSE